MGWLRTRATSTAGQTQAEYVVIAAGIAVAVVVAVLFLGGTFSALWDRSAKPVPGALTPPDDDNGVVVKQPSKKEDCEGNGYLDYPNLGFTSPEQCLAYLEKNPPPPSG